jgi:hypothetical protein
MLALMRASLTAALLMFSCVSAFPADKPYHRDDLAEAAVRLEGQIKADAGTVAKPLAALRRDADAAFARNDLQGGMQILGQIVAAAAGDTAECCACRDDPSDRPADDRERATLLDAPRRPPMSPISAPPTRARPGAGPHGTQLCRPHPVASGARRAAPVARVEGSRRCPCAI